MNRSSHLHTRTRSSSEDTVRLATAIRTTSAGSTDGEAICAPIVATLWVHDDNFSKAEVLINEDVFDDYKLLPTDLVQVVALRSDTEARDFEATSSTDTEKRSTHDHSSSDSEDEDLASTVPACDQSTPFDADSRTKYLCNPEIVPPEIKKQHPSIQISITSTIATTFGFRNRSQVVISLADRVACSASHVELSFKDIYLARSDMWRFVNSVLVRNTVYVGQKVVFLGSIRATVKSIHLGGRKTSTAYFSETTVPIFRSEAARYVLFIQMSQEMWDFDSEGDGEILWNRVIHGFLPDLFKRWSELEVKHMVTIVVFGRLEYRSQDLIDGSVDATPFEDFFRVVVTDMASASWTTILDELKRHFRVFLRDISLQRVDLLSAEGKPREHGTMPEARIRGRLSTALKGNFLETINIASAQFARDYMDRDLIRTGISVVVITAGTGIYEVNRELLNLTSQNLTDNGIGIDIVCLSAMPLHSAPLFKYRARKSPETVAQAAAASLSASPEVRRSLRRNRSFYGPSSSLTASSMGSTTSRSFSRVGSSVLADGRQKWCYGIPEWIDLSYWTAAAFNERGDSSSGNDRFTTRKKLFKPRVRMYELQMMGVMEHGLANIAIRYMTKSTRKRNRRKSRGSRFHKIGPGDYQIASDEARSSHSPRSRLVDHQRGLLSVQAEQQGKIFEDMDDYDADAFEIAPRFPSDPGRGSTTRNEGAKMLDSGARYTPPEAIKASLPPKDEKGKISPARTPLPVPSASQKRDIRISRSISYALRGLAPAPRAAASTELNIQHVQAQALLAKRPATPIGPAASIRSVGSNDHSRTTENDSVSEKQSNTGPQEVQDAPTQPISIKPTGRSNLAGSRRENAREELQSTKQLDSKSEEANSKKTPAAAEPLSDEDDISSLESFPGSVPQDVLPAIRNVNAANPIKNHPDMASWFGRWQHLYPRKPKTARVKWRSLCTPAAVPLTTPDLPSQRSLAEDFESSSYTVTLQPEVDLTELPRSCKSLLADMISLRLAHGYQWVTGPDRTESGEGTQHSLPCIFLPDRLGTNGNEVYLSMGNIVQQLTVVGADAVQVTRYVRNPPETEEEFPTSVRYRPKIRTILSESYAIQDLRLKGFKERYPWEYADRYLADTKKEWKDAVQKLRFWRARFVLLPVTPPVSAWKLAQSEETEEEIHLLGIRALTQMWQKQRHIPPVERRFKPSAAKRRRDTNPLEIFFQTLNPSEVVVTELDKLLGIEDGGDTQATQLLPESELLERETTTLPKLAQSMQGEKGIEIKSRRWHFKLHYNCFHGEQFTNWILQNFKDVETRDEAVEFGNELMKHGLFQHVNGRHNFKDGHYFYSIRPEYRVIRPDSRQSWFPTSRRSDRSVPATPITEPVFKESPLSARSRSGSFAAKEEEKKSSEEISIQPNNEKKKVSVSLSKMIRIDVDPRKRSDRPEVINLHYNRLHNPENCYHLELAWLNATSKLVEDAVVMWATQAEKYGLKLVEVPIAEVSKVSENEPFRAPYRISLLEAPPRKHFDGNSYFTSTSFVPHTPPAQDIHMYQKALLKKFNFVLDLEAASEFPLDVDVDYSWGNLEYQYTQYVHRSGMMLAQITTEGDLLLLANRLYNTRSAMSKDSSTKFDVRKDAVGPRAHPPAPSTLNISIPSPKPSPVFYPSTDMHSSKLVTPEQIITDLQSFCHDRVKLESFYRDVSLQAQQAKKSGSTSSSLLKPAAGPDPGGAIPNLQLPEAVFSAGDGASRKSSLPAES